MKIGSGKFRIDPVVYYQKVINSLTNPKWFYYKFYPKIRVEVMYTMLLIIAALGFILNTLSSFSYGFSPAAIVGIIIYVVFMLPFAALISAVCYYFMAMFSKPIYTSFKEMWRLACFTMTINGLLACVQVNGVIGFFSMVVSMGVGVWFSFNLLRYYFRLSKRVCYTYAAISAVMCAMSIVSYITILGLVNGIKSKHQSDYMQFIKQMKKIEKIERQYGH